MTERTVQNLLTLAGGIAMLLFCLVPFGAMVLVGLAARPDFLATGAFEPTLEHFSALFALDSLHFLDYLRNSLVVSGLSALAAVLVAALAAYAVTRMPLAGKVPLLLAVLALSMFPQVSLVGYLFRLMVEAGWINTWTALVLPYLAWILPLSLWILVSYFAQIPRELDRAAAVDGCTPWQALWRVLLPAAAPGVFSTFLLAFIFAFNEFMFALMLTTDYRARTVPVGIALFQGLHGEMPWGKVMAAATLTTLPVVFLILVFQRWIVQGLTRGAVKE